MMDTTGKRYYCVKRCEEGGEPCETQESDTPLDGWDCEEMFPVNFTTGANAFSQTDLAARGLSRFRVSRMYLQDPTWADHRLGPCWRIGWLYRIVPRGGSLWVVGGNNPLVSFVDNGNGTYTAEFNYVQTLVADAVNHLLILTDAKGKQWKFFDFSGAWNVARQGRLKEYDDRGGNITTTTYGSSGLTLDQLLEVQQTDPNPNLLHRFTFGYNLSGPSIGLLSSITYSQTNTGVTTTVRVANYSYYTSGGPNGPAGTLQRVRIADASANTLDTSYYRYNAAAGSGFVPLRVAVGAHSYDRLLAVLGSEAAIDGATDAAIAPYADFVFQYDAQDRVIQETVQGQGCGCGTSGGRGTYGYAYAGAAHGQPDGPNVWRNKCTVTLPDGNQRIVYTNGIGQTMLDLTKEVATGNQWRKYFVFNSDSSLAAMGFPSAVSGHDETQPALVTSAHLPDGSGLWHLFSYYSTTDLPNGAVAKYLSSRQLRQGELGTPILAETTKFTSRAAASATIFPMSSRTVYRNTDGTGGQTTNFGYSWQGTTTEVLQFTTTFPTVPTNQNGSGAATARTVQLDAYGRQTWLKDEDGFIEAREYDTLTSAQTRRIVDVNTTLVTNEPVGWVTPAGGGLHLITTQTVDGLGRTTVLTDPLGNLTYKVYRDPQHETRTYPGWNTATNLPTGPTELEREDRPGSYRERLTMSAAPAVTGGIPTGTEAVSGLQTLSRDFLDTGDRLVNSDSYFDFTGLTYSTSPSLGTLGVHFYRMLVNYDLKGRQDRVQDWTGTITRTVYDSRDRVSSSWMGTDDTPTTGDWSPTNTAGTNLVKVSSNEYDSNGVGDGNRTRSSLFTSALNSLDTLYQYDFRDRGTNQLGPDGVGLRRTYDNLDHVVVMEIYADGNSNFTLEAAELRRKTETRFDEKGKVYQTVVHQVDPATGTIGNRRTTNHTYNARGLSIRSKAPNGRLWKTQFDGALRVRATFGSFDDAETLYADADDVVSDTVFEETVTIFDAASNAIQTTRYERTSTTAKLGDLSVSWGAAQSRRTFVAQWFDKANRPTDVVNYGTNNGSNLTRPATPPAPNTSDNYLVTHTDFDSAGRPYRSVDNKARIAETIFDALGRPTKAVENRVDGTAAEIELDTDRTTTLAYDSSGRLSQKTALNPKGLGAGVEQQVTRYAYGTVATQASPAVFRNDLLAAVIYPDSDDTYNPAAPPGSQLGNGVDVAYDRVEFTYDYAGRQATAKDQRGVVRTTTYDSAGRPSLEAVTTLPAGVDGSILGRKQAYDDLSRVINVISTSDAAGLTAVNDVGTTYDGWGNSQKCEQAHTGLVGSGVGIPDYQETFADGAVGGDAKFIRTSSMIYPNGRVVYTNYPASGVGDKLNRVDNLADNAAGTNPFVQYTYLGENVFGRIDHPLVTNGLRREVDTGGNPSERDRFGRVLDERWKRSGATFNYDRYQYAYDRTSNRLSRDVTPNSPPTARDEFYAYDGLDRLTKVNRGNLSSGQITDANATFSQNWSALEAHGNWRTFVEDTNGGVAGGATTQSRSHNAANEVSALSGNSPAWAVPAYEAAGNVMNGPQAGNEAVRQHYTYDAWNRLVKVQADSGGSPGATIAEYQYDGKSRRIVKLKPNGANWDRRDYYYTCDWQVVEERELLNTASKTTVATVARYQWIWDLRFIDAPVLRDENKNGDAVCDGVGDERLFYTQDANYNTTALVSTAGTVVERYAYDPYGKAAVLSGTWTSQSSAIYGNEILYGGYRLDPESGLYHVRNRSYHATLGRFIQRDPSGYGDGMNRYQYVQSSPTGRIDPMGLATLSIVLKAGPTFGNCGALKEYRTEVKLSEAPKRPGFVIQHVTYSYDWTDCKGHKTSGTEEAWETSAAPDNTNTNTWALRPGTDVRPVKQQGANDNFERSEVGNCTEGIISIKGENTFYEGLMNIPPSMVGSTTPITAGMAATRTDPVKDNPNSFKGVNGIGPAVKYIAYKWYCCDGPSLSYRLAEYHTQVLSAGGYMTD